jgi:hypothetical protein
VAPGAHADGMTDDVESVPERPDSGQLRARSAALRHRLRHELRRETPQRVIDGRAVSAERAVVQICPLR